MTVRTKSCAVITAGLTFITALLAPAEETEDPKADFTLVNKHDLAERKKKWQEAVTQQAILARKNEELTRANEAKSDEIDETLSKLNSAYQSITQCKRLINFMLYEQPRIWKSNTGKALRAILIKDEGANVRLRTGLESEVSISRKGLSTLDIQLLDFLRAVENEEMFSREVQAVESNEEDTEKGLPTLPSQNTPAATEKSLNSAL